MGDRSDDTSGRSYRIRVTKIGHAIMGMKRHVEVTNIYTEGYLRNKILKARQARAVDRLNELTDLFIQLHKTQTLQYFLKWKRRTRPKNTHINTPHVQHLLKCTNTDKTD